MHPQTGILLLLGLVVNAQSDFVFPNTMSADQPTRSAPAAAPNRNKSAACVPISECPSLLQLLDSNSKGVGEFNSCGFDGHTPLFECPNLGRPDDDGGGDDGSECDCKDLKSCPSLDALARDRKFHELEQFKRCGFSDKIPLFCCPTRPKKVFEPSPEVRDLRGNNTNNRDFGLNNATHFESNKTVSKVNGTNDPRINIGGNSSDSDDEIDPECGFLTSLKIFGGESAGDHEFPWAAALAYVDAKSGSRLYLCGGTLISSAFVLTAGHCINSKGDHHLAQVRLGHADLAHESSVDVDIELVILHPDFEAEPQLRNDIALLKLAKPVDQNADLWPPACLGKPSDEIIAPTVIGWGLVNQENASSILQKLVLNITTNQDCQAIYESRIPGFTIAESQLCATGAPGTDSCKGDSGGPLLFVDSRSRFRVVGVTSFGTVKCDSSVPGVYTRVAQYRTWIKSVIEEQS